MRSLVITCAAICALSCGAPDPRGVGASIEPPPLRESASSPRACLASTDLDAILSRALADARFDEVIDLGRDEPSTCAVDRSCGRIARTPSVDVAVIAFPPGCPPAFANALVSSETGGVKLARFDPARLDVRGIRYRKWDQAAWDGAPRRFTASDDLVPRPNDPADGAVDFVSPYPASNFKLLVAVKLLELVDRGVVLLERRFEHEGRERDVGAWLADMITWSDDDSTEALVRLLHELGYASTVDATFERLGLATLQMEDTSATTGRGWHPGHIHMTAWDTARLLWLLDPDAPAPTWIAPDGAPVDAHFLTSESRQRLLALLGDQAFHALDVPDHSRGGDATADVTFAHKTGLTLNFGSDAGIVRAVADRARRHYVIAFFSNLGHRYADADLVGGEGPCRDRGVCYTRRIAELGGTIDAAIDAPEGAPDLRTDAYTAAVDVAVARGAFPEAAATRDECLERRAAPLHKRRGARYRPRDVDAVYPRRRHADRVDRGSLQDGR